MITDEKEEGNIPLIGVLGVITLAQSCTPLYFFFLSKNFLWNEVYTPFLINEQYEKKIALLIKSI